MKREHWWVAAIITLVLGGLVAALVLFVRDPVVLQPSGQIGREQRDLWWLSLGIMSIVAVPVFVMLAVIAWRYRASNPRAEYRPHWAGDRRLEMLWWGIPIVIVGVLSVVAWRTSHSLDPYQSLASTRTPLRVQVVALRWKWLFLYPDNQLAVVNRLVIPEHTPVQFDIASDAPMNSFWIPELGGQIYAMSGMNTTLHLIADHTGEFRGMSSNISGEGFADMTFTVAAVSQAVFADWSSPVRWHTEQPLTPEVYEQVAQPSIVTEPQYYQLTDSGLYRRIIDKYAMPHSSVHQSTPSDTLENEMHGGMH